MSDEPPLFKVDVDGDTAIIVPTQNLNELEFERFEAQGREIMDDFEKRELRNVVLDFSNTDYYGSSSLVFFLKLLERVQRRGGRMVLCNLSDHEREILRVTKLDSRWLIYESRVEARQAVRDVTSSD